MDANIAMIAMTTSNSISVKRLGERFRIRHIILDCLLLSGRCYGLKTFRVLEVLRDEVKFCVFLWMKAEMHGQTANFRGVRWENSQGRKDKLRQQIVIAARDDGQIFGDVQSSLKGADADSIRKGIGTGNTPIRKISFGKMPDTLFEVVFD